MQPADRIVVIGGGPAGRHAARFAIRHGVDTVLVAANLGPRRRLNQAAIRFLATEAERVSQAWEPEGPSPGLEYAPAMRETLVGALEIAARDFENEIVGLRAIGVRIVEGKGRIAATDAVAISTWDGQVEYLSCRAMILATGEEALLDPESPRVLTPESLPSLEEVPESLIVLGSSPAALELARFFASYGVFVTVVGARHPALYFLDSDLHSGVLNRAVDSQVRVLADVTAVAGTSDGRVDLLLSDGSHIDADYVLARREGSYRTTDLDLETPGIVTGADGEIITDEEVRTNIPEIFGVGSVTGYRTLNVAVRQAEVAAENALGGNSAISYDVIPVHALFRPEIGAVGVTQSQASQADVEVLISNVCVDNPPAPVRCVKLLADGTTGRLIGLHAVGEGAAEAAHLGALAIHAGVTVDEIAELAPIEGTMVEAVSTAAMNARTPILELVKPLVIGPD